METKSQVLKFLKFLRLKKLSIQFHQRKTCYKSTAGCRAISKDWGLQLTEILADAETEYKTIWCQLRRLKPLWYTGKLVSFAKKCHSPDSFCFTVKKLNALLFNSFYWMTVLWLTHSFLDSFQIISSVLLLQLYCLHTSTNFCIYICFMYIYIYRYIHTHIKPYKTAIFVGLNKLSISNFRWFTLQ